MKTVKRTVTALAVGAVLAFGAVPAIALVAGPAPVAAAPGDPCDIPPSANSCEGPVQPDGSRRRCNYAPAYRTGGTLIPEIKTCQLVPGGQP